jgi:hypothetical protein
LKFRKLLVIKLLRKITGTSHIKSHEDIIKLKEDDSVKSKLQNVFANKAKDKRKYDAYKVLQQVIEREVEETLSKYRFFNSKHLNLIEQNIK